MALFLTSCVSLEKQFRKKPVEAAELCRIHFPTKILEEKETIIFKSDTILIPGDSVECEVETIVKDSIIEGKTIKIPVYIPKKAKCPDSKEINNEKESKKETIIKDTSCDLILSDREKQIKKLKDEIDSKKKQLFWLYLILGVYIAYKLVRLYIKSKTKNPLKWN